MLGRIVEISGEGRRLSLYRGFLEISGPEGLLGQVPLDDIEAVIASNPAILTPIKPCPRWPSAARPSSSAAPILPERLPASSQRSSCPRGSF